MFKIIRKYKLWRNHQKRIGSICIRSNDEIIKALDYVHGKMLENERKGNDKEFLIMQGRKEMLEWLINDSSDRTS